MGDDDDSNGGTTNWKRARRFSVSGLTSEAAPGKRSMWSSLSGNRAAALTAAVRGDNVDERTLAAIITKARAFVAAAGDGAVHIVAERNTLEGTEFVLTANSCTDAGLRARFEAGVRQTLRAPWSLSESKEDLPVDAHGTLTEPAWTFVLARHPLVPRPRPVFASACLLVAAAIGALFFLVLLGMVLSTPATVAQPADEHTR